MGGCSLFELIGDGTFFRCIRKEVVNAAGTEVIVILCVAILVLAVVAGVLAYEWRVQGGRPSRVNANGLFNFTDYEGYDMILNLL